MVLVKPKIMNLNTETDGGEWSYMLVAALS